VHSILLNPDRLERSKRWVYDKLADGKLKPVVARTFDLKQIVEAHRYMELNEHMGKIVVTVGNP
jgi:NADPH:quinone reductase-like Zn-dependent oxidoreductase